MSGSVIGSGEPPYLHPAYGSTVLRAPLRPLVAIPATLTEATGPWFGAGDVSPADADLTRQHSGEPLGQRIVVAGRVFDGDGSAVRGALVEVWQANAAGRYAHAEDQHDAPLDPNFSGSGRCLTGADGGYRFVTIDPGAYPWKNHPNAWRPSHIHFSVFGPGLAARLITQMYFPGDPLLPLDPILTAIPDPAARARLVARFDLDLTVEGWALGYRFDIVLGGPRATPAES
jgi:protocatechuate 3,4-dioxygenase beta subunit